MIFRRPPRSTLGEKIQPKIAPIVEAFNNAGIGTISSGDSPHPWVECEDVGIDRVHRLLCELGFDGGYTVSHQFVFTRSSVAASSIMVMFWLTDADMKRVVGKG